MRVRRPEPLAMAAADPVSRLRQVVLASGSPLAGSIGDAPLPEPAGDGDPAAIAATGPRAAPHPAEIELAVAAVHQGYALHYDSPHAFAIDDPDLRLLAGDRLYALGLERLAAIGDLAAIVELADVIALSAQAHAAADPELARAAWEAGVAGVGWGSDAELDAAKAGARAGDPQAVSALRGAALDARSTG